MDSSSTFRRFLDSARKFTYPPLVLEVVLKSGRSFYIKSILEHIDTTPDDDIVHLRVWDLRTLSEYDLRGVTTRLNEIRIGDPFEMQDLHPAIGQANLWVRLSEIEAILAWHDSFWPTPPIFQAPPRSVF
jgi:hypothetical protein